MKKTKKQTRGWFAIVACLIFLGGSLAVATNLSKLISARNRLIDSLITQSIQSKQKNDLAQMFSLLATVQSISFGDSRPASIIANEYALIGRYDLVEKTILQSGIEPNYIYLGNAALKAQHYSAALVYFSIAIREQKNVNSLSGLGRALISVGRTKEGCAKNQEARKNDLSDKVAETTEEICQTVGGEKDSQRALAYKQANVFMYEAAEKTLLEEQDKTAKDWMLLAQIAAARGDLGRAVERTASALELDDIDPRLTSFALKIYELRISQLGLSSKESNSLQSMINQLNTKFQHLPSY